MAQGVDAYRFSTGDWAEKDRIEGWRETLGRAVMRLEIDPVRDKAFRAEMVLQALPGLGLAEGTCSGMHFRRTTQFIDNDDLVLNVVIQGRAEIRQRGREEVLRAGDAVLTTGGDTGETVLRSGARMRLLRIPRVALADLTGDLEAAVMRFLPAKRHALRLLIGYTDLVRGMGASMDPAAAGLAARHVRDLMALALGSTREGVQEIQARGLGAARLGIIKADILKSAAQPDLSIGRLAQRHGLSVRYIHMLLAEAETTFGEIVMYERLDRAYRMLSGPGALKKPIGTIALEVGFSDLSYFHRAFRRRYGVSPGEVRAGNLDRPSEE